MTHQPPSVRDRAAAAEVRIEVLTLQQLGAAPAHSVEHIAAILARHYSTPSPEPAPRPSTDRKKVCLCGSTRFKRAWLEWNARLTLGEGAVVLTVAMWSHNERIDPTPEQKIMLDEIHKAKIDDSDEIFVLDVGGYIGSSTRSEIEHAERTHKRVRYLSREFPEWTEEDSIYAGPLVRDEPGVMDDVKASIKTARSCLQAIRKAGKMSTADRYSFTNQADCYEVERAIGELENAKLLLDHLSPPLSTTEERSVENG